MTSKKVSDTLESKGAQKAVKVSPESGAQARSTLRVDQLQAVDRQASGSRLIADEIRQLSKSIQEESRYLRKEIANLPVQMTTALKSVFEEAREQRNMTAAFNRRPVFGPNRRFPVFRRVARIFVRKSADSSTNTPGDQEATNTLVIPIPSPSTTPPDEDPNSSGATLKAPTSMKSLKTSLKNAWLRDNSAFFDQTHQSDSTDTTPSSSP